ncbi:hypothetical protein DFH05DRAFT_1609801 [Lentinula detonsa]|uniref:Uncharacterized protein n=1 Tax=Lentinula detonsa TaxID=2804962 RepID=A0A9W8TYC9_9AGAR|nr:hypothetical protein DFH05DRAFT_1609801 [Lentinula detonsa]
MDNPWHNAWDESQSKNSPPSAPQKSLFSTSTWKDPTENETDIALPSWSAGPAVTWNEPSDDAPTLWAASTSNDSATSKVSPTLSPKVARWTSPYESMSAHFGDSGSSVDGNSETEEREEDEVEEEEVLVEEWVRGEDEKVHESPSANNEALEADGQEEHETTTLKTSEVIDPWTPPQSVFPTSTSLSSVLSTTTSNSPPAPGSPDAFEFGTFESGASDSIGGPSVDDSLPNPDAEWGTAWAAKETDLNDKEEEEVLDQWERARREKEKMDRAVPPELLAYILHTLEGIADDLWPSAPQPKAKDVDKGTITNTSQKYSKDTSELDHSEGDVQRSPSADDDEGQDIVERTVTPKPRQAENQTDTWKDETQSEDFLLHWKGGIDAVEHLSELSHNIAPPLPPLSSLPLLPSQSSNPQSPILKRSSEALRLTRSTVTSSSGPFGLYLKSKGSIEWEVAVKARPEKTSEQEREEIVPAGWRILPKENENEKKVEAPEMKKKGSSILSSFFGRKTETSPAENRNTSKDESPRPSLGSSRNSLDSTVSKTELKAESPSTKLPAHPVSAPVPSTSAASTSTTTNALSTYGDGGPPDFFQDVPTTAPAPSAVSRFLNRFSSSSRNRPSHSRQNSNASLALSTDDLEFLEDIVPSASDDHEHDNGLVQTGTSDLTGLQKMIESAPLPAPLLPPPRAPQPQPQLSSPRSPSDDFVTGKNGPSDASRLNKNFSFASSPTQILAPSPALPSQIQTAIAQSSKNNPTSRSSTPSSFASPLSTRSSSPGLDILAVAGSSSATGGRASQLTGTGRGAGMNALGGMTGTAISRPPSSVVSNSRTSSSTMKRPAPVAIMSSSSVSSTTSEPVSSFNFLPPPPSIRGSRTTTPTLSLLIDDEPVTHVPSGPSAPALPSDGGLDDDDFSDFLSANTTDATEPPFSASHLFSLSSAQPLFSAGSTAFDGVDSTLSNAPPEPYNNPLNTSVSSVASANSANDILLSGSGSNSFGSFPDESDDYGSSFALREMLRTPSPPALPAKSPGKIAARKAFGTEPSNSGVRRTLTAKKNVGGSGVGGRIAPERLNLPPVSSSAYSRNWGTTSQESSPIISSGIPSDNTVNSASPFVASSSEPALAKKTPPASPFPKTHQKRVSKEAHQRTRSLVEDAMARSGIWPSAQSAVSSTGGYGSESGYGAYGFGTAPPLSPLPPILSPPPESFPSKMKRGDLLGGHDDDDDDVPLASLTSGSTYGSTTDSAFSFSMGSTFATQQADDKLTGVPSISSMSASIVSPATASSLHAANDPNLNRNGTLPPLPLPGPTPPQQPALLMDFGLFGLGPGSATAGVTSSLKSPENGYSTVSSPPLMSAHGSAPLSSTSKKTTGGLSAQDLSFFEGL